MPVLRAEPFGGGEACTPAPVFTASPQISKVNFRRPTTPDMTGCSWCTLEDVVALLPETGIQACQRRVNQFRDSFAEREFKPLAHPESEIGSGQQVQAHS
jgi:hypothetical protein